jgi:hypothetical protein
MAGYASAWFRPFPWNCKEIDMADDSEVMNALMAKIYDVVGERDPVNNRVGRDTYLSISRPGVPITPESLTFSFLASTLKEADAAAGFADFANIIPADAPFWQPSSRRVFDEYWRCIDQPILPVTELSEAEVKKLNKAREVLEAETVVVDHNTGEIRKVATESMLYERYLAREAAYLTALDSYNSSFEDYVRRKDSDPNAELIWLKREPALSKRVKSSYQRWQAAGMMQIQSAISVRDSLERRGAERIFDERRQRFQQHARGLGADGAQFQFTKYFPDRFWESPDNWTRVSFVHNEVHKVDEHTVERIGGGAGAGFGLWSFGGSFQRNKDDKYARCDTNDVDIAFSLAKIPIRRSWMDGGVLRSRNWALNYDLTSRAENFSDGAGKGTMPLVPVALLVARDVRLNFSMSSEVNTYAMEEISGSARAGWGPFSVRGNYYKKTEKQTHDFVRDGKGLEIKGMQVIGFVLESVPKCPNPDPALGWPEGTKYEDISPDAPE